MTKYRTVSNGYWEYLQYEYEYKYLFFFKKTKWLYVWYPYYDKITGRYYLDCPSDYGYVNSLRGIRPDEFVKTWPEIDAYFKWATEEQNRLVKISEDHWSGVNNKKNEVRYF